MVDTKFCTGCEACANCCPVAAIQMIADEEGFLYPRIDTEKCIQCGLCHRICPVAVVKQSPYRQDRGWMFMAQEHALRNTSSSGGAFPMLAQRVLDKGGIVFGCRLDEDCYGVSHAGVDTEAESYRLRGSKYVQSRIGNTLCQVEQALAEGKWVLFAGTPCQVAGLQSFLGDRPRDKLLTVDLICHGVPSPKVWQIYAKELEAKAGAKLTQVSFRDKSLGWRTYSLHCSFDNGTVYSRTVLEDLYLRGFVENLYLRPCCHSCSFKGDHYKSDITLGDFWGVEMLLPELTGENGVSLALAHTEKGVAALETLTSGGILREVTGEDILKHNSAFYRAAPPSPFRDRVLTQVGKKPIGKLLKKYCGNSLEARVRKKLRMLTRK